MEDKQFEAIIATTHLDRHNERFTISALEGVAKDLGNPNKQTWMLWNHQSTLPPLGVLTGGRLEERSDGEHQVVATGIYFGSERKIPLAQSGLAEQIPSKAELEKLLASHDFSISDDGYIEVSVDRQNIDFGEAGQIIDEVNEQLPAKLSERGRKAEVPQEVIWILIAFAGGFVARLGEVTADGLLAFSELAIGKLTEKLSKLLKKSKPTGQPDVIFQVEIPNSDVLVEGALEYATEDVLETVWSKLPELYLLAENVIARNRPKHFAVLRYLFNPYSNEWEINYFLTRNSKRVILGKRYTDPNHPLRRRWVEQNELIQQAGYDRSVSVG